MIMGAEFGNSSIKCRCCRRPPWSCREIRVPRKTIRVLSGNKGTYRRQDHPGTFRQYRQHRCSLIESINRVLPVCNTGASGDYTSGSCQAIRVLRETNPGAFRQYRYCVTSSGCYWAIQVLPEAIMLLYLHHHQ